MGHPSVRYPAWLEEMYSEPICFMDGSAVQSGRVPEWAPSAWQRLFERFS
jgi:hypothetical protein